MEWLLYVVALTDDPAMAHGAFLNIQALMRAKVHPYTRLTPLPPARMNSCIKLKALTCWLH